MSKKEHTATAIRFPPDLHDRLRVAADEHDLSVNWMVVKAVQEFLDLLVPPEEVRFTRPREEAPVQLAAAAG